MPLNALAELAIQTATPRPPSMANLPGEPGAKQIPSTQRRWGEMSSKGTSLTPDTFAGKKGFRIGRGGRVEEFGSSLV